MLPLPARLYDNRIVDQHWFHYGGSSSSSSSVKSSPDLDHYVYGYDRNSNRIWKQNVLGSGLDEFYTYDRLNRLTVMKRGTLTGTPPSGITGTPVAEQDWTLDPTGNWGGYVTKASGTTSLNQTRTSNKVNELTGITETVGTSWPDPAYDPAGNTTTFPKFSNLTQSFTATYDAWNRLHEVKDGGTSVAVNRYDGRNRRITRTASSTTRHLYYSNAWQVLEERIGATRPWTGSTSGASATSTR